MALRSILVDPTLEEEGEEEKKGEGGRIILLVLQMTSNKTDRNYLCGGKKSRKMSWEWARSGT